MALYLGEQKVGMGFVGRVEIPVPTGNYASGTAVADDNGVVTFPELGFTPKLIALWNVYQRDLKEEAEAEGWDWEEDWVRYVHSGFMLFGIYQDDTWVTQALTSNSGEALISNETWSAGPAVSVSNNRYSYSVAKLEQYSDYFAGETFNYVILG